MKPELFVLLLEHLRDFSNREDAQVHFEDFYWNDETVMVLARSLEATWNAMAHAAKSEAAEYETS